MEPKESPILQGLNPAQRDAVVNYDSPSLIIAGAGSGKTRVLTSRIAYMIEQGVAPFNILALTFTNKAAQQMRERIAQMIPDNRSRYIRMGTFHSVFSRILRENAEKIGFPESFTIYEPSDCKNLIKTIVRELNLADEKYKPNLIASRISYAKNCLVTPGAYLANSVYAAEDRQAQIPEFGNVYNIYCQRCQRNGAMDFDDLLLQTNILLRDAPDVLARYQELFKYILVDEYQDTNYAQYVIIRRLSQLPGLRRGRRRTVDLLVPRCQDREHSLLPEGFSRGQGLQARAELPLDPHDRRCGQFGHRPQLQAHGEALFLGRRRG